MLSNNLSNPIFQIRANPSKYGYAIQHININIKKKVTPIRMQNKKLLSYVHIFKCFIE